ncbi:MAG: hypothetical protein HY046_03680, partial [Acidobacteria bacterium]|nr:hypothetical protein [Acidobacteriota bacterium]
SGTLQFAQPVNGRVFAAVFNGSGRIEVQPPNGIEAHQLRVNAGQASLNMEFTEATLTFSDETFEEVGRKLTIAGGGSAQAGELYHKRQTDREDVGAEMLPRIFKSLLSKDRKRTAYFAADLKTREKSWVLAQVDALEPEAVRVGRWVNWGPVTRFDTWMQFPAGGISAAEAFRDPLAREDFKIDSYRINATVTNGAELLAETKVSFTNRAAGETVLVFELDANLRLESVKDEKGASLTFFQPREPKDRSQSYGDYAAIVLSVPTAAGQTQTLEFKYGGKRVVRKEGSGNYFCQSYGWYPTRPNSFAVRSDFEMNFKSPKRYSLVATGNKVSSTTDGDWAISTWKSDLPLAVAGFAYGDYKIVTDKVGEIDIEIYANKEGDDIMKSVQNALGGSTLPQQIGTGNLSGAAIGTLTPATQAKTMATEIANTLRIFENYFGPYPYKRLAVSSLPLGYSYGQGWPTHIYLWSLSFLDAQQRHTLGIKDHVQLTDFFRAHESSHQWWGHRVGWKSYHDQWLSEGFAEFSGNLYVQFRKGEKEFTTRLKQDRDYLRTLGDDKSRHMESLGPIWMGTRLSTADARGAYSFLIYTKGGYVLSMLRMMLYNSRSQNPEERFITMMRDFTQTYNNRAASTEDFKVLVEKYMTSSMDLDQNKKMDWFFNQYVYGTGIPEYNFRYNIEPTADGKFKVSGNILRSGVYDGWKDSLPIYMVQGGRNLRLGWISAKSANEPFEFVLPMKPEKLILNANEDILAEIKQ